VTAFRIATQTASLGPTLVKALHTAAQVGCEGVQFDARQEVRSAELSETGLRQLRKLLDDLNLRVGSVAFPTRRGYGNPLDLERRLEATVGAMRLASQLHCRVLVVQLGRLPADPDSKEIGTLKEALTALSQQGTRLGVQLAAQVSFDTYDHMEDFLASLPEGTVSLDLHPGKLIAQGHTPEEFVRRLGQHIVHVHASDSVRDLGPGRWLEVELGRGSADFPAILGSLEEHEYRGWVTIERTESSQPVEDVSNAVRYLRTLQHAD